MLPAFPADPLHCIEDGLGDCGSWTRPKKHDFILYRMPWGALVSYSDGTPIGFALVGDRLFHAHLVELWACNRTVLADGALMGVQGGLCRDTARQEQRNAKRESAGGRHQLLGADLWLVHWHSQLLQLRRVPWRYVVGTDCSKHC